MCWNKTATVWWVSDYQITWLPGRESRRQITQMCESYCFLSCSQEEKQKRKHDGGRNRTSSGQPVLFCSLWFPFHFVLLLVPLYFLSEKEETRPSISVRNRFCLQQYIMMSLSDFDADSHTCTFWFYDQEVKQTRAQPIKPADMSLSQMSVIMFADDWTFILQNKNATASQLNRFSFSVFAVTSAWNADCRRVS